MVVTYVHAINRNVCNIIYEKQAWKRYPIFLTEYHHNYNIDKIGRIDKIEFQRNLSDEDDK